MKEALKLRARELGADLVGVTSAAFLPESRAYDEWVAAGMQGTMEYMAENADSRRDIRAWCPSAKSVVVCGFSYSDAAGPRPRPGHGRLSRYAALPDYHKAIKDRMLKLSDWIRERVPGAYVASFVDHSPILERLYAWHAGLGWVGKNTMMLSPRLGSYFFLAGLATSAELEPDAREADHCGSCTKCLEACPTQAFPKERVLDASLCITYLNIEHRGPIPEALRPKVGDWLAGCDVCQEVCPWNRFAKRGPVFPPQGPLELFLEEAATLGQDAFRARYKKTPLQRAKRRGLVRNALLAMGNEGDPRYRPTLEHWAKDEDETLAEQARWSLARLRS